MKLFVLFALIASCSAFAPAASVRPAVARRSAMPVRQVAPVMELETVDTWCADALICSSSGSQRSERFHCMHTGAFGPLTRAASLAELRGLIETLRASNGTLYHNIYHNVYFYSSPFHPLLMRFDSTFDSTK